MNNSIASAGEHNVSTMSAKQASAAIEERVGTIPIWNNPQLDPRFDTDLGFWAKKYKPTRVALVACTLSIPLVVVGICVILAGGEGSYDNVYVKTSLHCGYAFAIGWTNCIMALRYRTFATMMVGNTVLMGISLVCHETSAAAKGLSSEDVVCMNVRSIGHYGTIIVLFLFGSFLHGFLEKTFGWTPRIFAPIVAFVICTAEMLRLSVLRPEHYVWELYGLSATFGVIASISSNCGVGAVPYPTTGNMVSIGYGLSGLLTNFQWAGAQKVFVNICLCLSFITGIVMGAVFHSFHSLMLNSLTLAGLLYANAHIFPPASEEEDIHFDAILKVRGSAQRRTDGSLGDTESTGVLTDSSFEEQ